MTSTFADFQKSSDFICKSYNESISKSEYISNAGESFRKAFPINSHNDFFKGLREDFGKCEKVTFEVLENKSALVKVQTSKIINNLSIYISSSELITGLLFVDSSSLDGEIEKQASYICGLFKKNSKIEYEKHFTPAFVKAVPLEQFAQITKGIYAEYGECKSYKLKISSGDAGTLKTEHSKKLNFSLNLDHKTRLISGLLFKGEDTPKVDIKSDAQLKSLLEKMPGRKMMYFKKYGQDLNFAINASEDFALGSAFKLFILLTLEDKITKGELTWKTPLAIKEELKSFPSGVMQNIPAGETREIYEYARKMIEISDNTATDHLLDLIGKESVEKVVKSLGVENSGNIPFLSTMEMFRTRALFSKTDVKKYKSANRNERLLMLNKLKQVPREELIKGIQAWGNTPKYISSIEWFASATDICRLLEKLDETKSEQVLKILSYNAPFVAKDLSEYAGYKGGSEPGVIFMAYLLKSKDERSCFIASQNDTKKAVNQGKFFSVIEGSLKYFLKKKE